jgi:capsular polysaccharide biosynthesis protein
MANDLNQPLYFEDEIDLKEIFKILIESKKLIISTILIFIIASIIYSLSLKPSFESSTTLEIGYVTTNNVDRESIESTSELISDLNILLMKNPDGKFSQNISMNAFEDKIINFATTSSSGEQNENFLNEVIRYIDERHSNIAVLASNREKTKISQKIETIKSNISFIKAKQLDENQFERLKIKDRIAILKSNLPLIDLKIKQFEKVIIDDTNNLSLVKRNEEIRAQRASNSPTLEQIIFSYNIEIDLNTLKNTNILETESLNNQLITLENATLQSDELFSLEQQQKTLENQLQLLMTQVQIKTRPIRNIDTKTIKPKTQLTIILGLISGFITSIFLVFIRRFVKNL